MAKVHYILDSRKKAQISKNAKGNISVIIDDVVKVKENNVVKLDYAEFINYGDKNSNKYKVHDYATMLLYLFAVALLILMFIMMAIGKDFGLLTSRYIDNVIGITALLFGIVSIPRIKEYLGKKLLSPPILNKLWYIIILLCLPFYIVMFMSWGGLSSSISNVCGIIGIFICIFVW